jgi:nitrogen-specific signal transduction histidine kinase
MAPRHFAASGVTAARSRPRLPDVLGDRVQLLQVILNLIRNAVEAMSTDRRCIKVRTLCLTRAASTANARR